MSIKAMLEQRERDTLSPYAQLSSETRGRERETSPDDMRTEFQRDRDRILHCKSFRRLKGKTQVFLSPQGDHYRTRLTHTLEVTQVARTIARALRLNEDLAEAIAMGHDLGHTPFGHAGEDALNQIIEGGFEHREQSRRVVEVLENEGRGLNLTWEVRDGILCHSGEKTPSTLEGWCVRRADRIAYISHDIDDAIRGGILKEYERDKYIFITEARILDELILQKFDILDRVRAVRVGDTNLPLTISMGVSNIHGSYEEKERTAHAALDMALQRGGDHGGVKAGKKRLSVALTCAGNRDGNIRLERRAVIGMKKGADKNGQQRRQQKKHHEPFQNSRPPFFVSAFSIAPVCSRKAT